MNEYLKKYWVLLVIVALAQTLALAWMVGGRLSLLNSSRLVILETVPVDPRSLFRGYYVRLAYNITTLDKKLLTGDPELKRNDQVYVTVRAKNGEKAVPIAVGVKHPVKLGADEIAIRGRVVYSSRVNSTNQSLRVRYGLERYYVPEGEGKRLERMVGKNNFAVLAAVGSSGEAAIKGLMIDGKLQYEEPLF